MFELLGYESLFQRLNADGMQDWSQALEKLSREALSSRRNSDYTRWAKAIESLEPPISSELEFGTSVVTVSDASEKVATPPTERAKLNPQDQATGNRNALRALMPWRKGPFCMNGISIETEWRSDLKWNRIETLADWDAAMVLDVGCGNGYFGWRMLHQGADHVVGLDPYLLYVMQHTAIRKFTGPYPNYVLPVGDGVLAEPLGYFDVALSMGVLYHRANPIEHLVGLRSAIKPGGRLILETLVVEGNESTALVPADRYAKMRNVWFLPSVKMLQRWLQRCGFQDVRHEDSTATTPDEQRQTDWMEYESLADFLDPNDSSKTMEGHPAPLRAILTATRR